MQARRSIAKRARRDAGRALALAFPLVLIATLSGQTPVAARFDAHADVAAPTSSPARSGVNTARQQQSDGPKKAGVTVRAIRPEKATVEVGEPVRVAFDVETPAPWHFYPAAQKPLLGKQTVFEFDQAAIAGPIEEPKPKYYKYGVIETDYHEGNVTITVPIRLKPGIKAGPLELKGRIVYQICDLNVCLNNVTPFQFTITVLEAD